MYITTSPEQNLRRFPSYSEIMILIGIPVSSTIIGLFDGYALAAHFVGVSPFELLTRPLTDFKPYHSLISASGFIGGAAGLAVGMAGGKTLMRMVEERLSAS